MVEPTPTTNVAGQPGDDRTHIYEDQAGEWRWRRIAPNGEVIADSGESYTRHADAERAAHRVFGTSPLEGQAEQATPRRGGPAPPGPADGEAP